MTSGWTLPLPVAHRFTELIAVAMAADSLIPLRIRA